MEDKQAVTLPADTQSREVVHWYVAGGKEVVEYYVQDRPLPGKRPEPTPSAKRRRGLRRIPHGLRIFLLCLLGLTVLTGGFLFFLDRWQASMKDPFAYGWDFPQPPEKKRECTIERYPNDSAVRLRYQTRVGRPLSSSEVFDRVILSTVTVMAEWKDGISIGTGVLITDDGYLLTNAHVIEEASACMVYLADGSMFEAKLLGFDSGEDIAVLKIEGENLPAAEIGNSDALLVGEAVYAIGNPLGVELVGTFTNGIVSAVERPVEMEGKTLTLIQTNAALNNGNSGGPLINAYGQVVGINTMKMGSAYSNVEGLGFALPISSISYMINQLIAYGEVRGEPILGFSIATLPEALSQGGQGFRILSIDPGYGGELAGLQQNDLVVEVDGQPMESVDTLLCSRRAKLAGETLLLGIYRDGSYQQIVLPLLERQE